MGRRKRSVVERARARSARIAAGTAWARLHRGSRAAFCGHGEHRKLRGELLALAFRARGFVFAENERVKLVLAFLADVLEDRHWRLPTNLQGRLGSRRCGLAGFYLKSDGGDFAITR